jgi:uncharacterized protein (TIGR00297 family)
MVTLEAVLVTLVLCTSLSALAYFKGVLTWDGSVAAWGVGFVIGIFGDILWLFLLLVFLVTSFAATRYKFTAKEETGGPEGGKGERRFTNVMANGLAPSVVALASSFLAPDLKNLAGLVFVSSVAVAGSDTLASEIGVLSPRTWNIMNLKAVKAGTDGGVSFLGEGAALLAALYTALAALALLNFLPSLFGWSNVTIGATYASFAIITLVGFVGFQVDSVLGATLELRGAISKKSVNLISTSLGAILALSLARLL